MLLFPPISYKGAYRGYEFIVSITPGCSVNTVLLFFQLLGVLLIGALLLFIARTGDSPLNERGADEDNQHLKPR